MSRAGAGVRPPAVAGSFYPADPDRLRATVDALLAAAAAPPPLPGRLVGVVVPHAGYQYSGPVAASAYALVAAAADQQRVLVLGPAHFVPVRGVAASARAAFATPLGEVPVGAPSGARCDDEPHRDEHSIEVQLPFLQRTWPGATVLPVLVGQADTAEVADLIDAAGDPFVVVSSDLSHYHDHETAQRLDRRTADAVTALDGEAIRDVDACGARPLRGLLAWCRRHAATVTELDRRTSADTAGRPDRVVGYGAFAVTLPDGA